MRRSIAIAQPPLSDLDVIKAMLERAGIGYSEFEVNSTREVRGLTEVTTGTMLRVVDGPRSVGVDLHFNPHGMLSALIGAGPEL
jgi:hypothetical protein